MHIILKKKQYCWQSDALWMRAAAFGHEVVKTARHQDKKPSLNTESINSVSCLGCVRNACLSEIEM